MRKKDLIEMIAIVDYGAGNLSSVRNALQKLGLESRATGNSEEILTADRVILPGVGSFGFLMQSLRQKGLDAAIRQSINKGTPFLGICLGMQALFESSEESPGVAGLGVFKGKVVRFQKGKVPQIGWNEVVPNGNDIGGDRLFNKGFAYFVNSFYCAPEDASIVAATTDYCGDFACAVQKGNITAVQFHPEKSGDWGLAFLRRWAGC